MGRAPPGAPQAGRAEERGSAVRWPTLAAGLLLALGTAVATAVWAAGRTGRSEDPGLARAQARGYLIAGVPLWMPPFGAPARRGGWAGLDVALAREVAEVVLGDPGRVHLLPLTAGERVWAVRAGAADFVAAAYAADGPGEAPDGVVLLGPYFTDRLALAVRRGRPVQALDDLDGQVVGVLPGSLGGAALRAAAGAAATPVLEEFVSAGAAARALAAGRLRALVGGEACLRALASLDPELAVQVFPGLGTERYWVLAPAGSPGLADAIARAVAALPRGAALTAALAAWSAGADTPPLPAPAPAAVLTGPGGGP
jgi:ABC-type amino acid transport substrate-binding protein